MNANQADALAGLRDIHLPEAVSFWPLAPGWWIAVGLFMALALAAHFYRGARRRSLKRAALAELAGIETSYQRSSDVSQLALEISVLLRRVALRRFRRHEVASLHGEDWAQFLLRNDDKRGLSDESASSLSTAIYAGPHAQCDEEAPAKWLTAARHWIRGNT
jgi:hypothetical protein